MKVLVLFALVAFAMADDLPQPVQDTPEVAMARSEHLAAVEAQKSLIASIPKEIEAPVLAYAAPYYNGYYPYHAAAPAPYSHFNYGYTSYNPVFHHLPYPYIA